MTVIGITTPRKFPMKGGRISAHQVEYVRERTCDVAPPVIKILVTHHPLDLPEDYKKRNLVHRARAAVEALSPCVDLMLAGHLHLSSTERRPRVFIRPGIQPFLRRPEPRYPCGIRASRTRSI